MTYTRSIARLGIEHKCVEAFYYTNKETLEVCLAW